MRCLCESGVLPAGNEGAGCGDMGYGQCKRPGVLTLESHTWDESLGADDKDTCPTVQGPHPQDDWQAVSRPRAAKPGEATWRDRGAGVKAKGLLMHSGARELGEASEAGSL